MNEEIAHYGYAVIKQSERAIFHFSFGRNYDNQKSKFDQIKEIKGPSRNDETKPEGSEVKRPFPGEQSVFSSALKENVKSLVAYYDLVEIGYIMPPAIFSVEMNDKIADPLSSSQRLIENCADTTFYGITRDFYNKILSHIQKIERTQNALDALPTALLLSIVAKFDSITSDIVRVMFNAKPTMMQFGDKVIAFSEVFQAKSLDDIKDKMLSDEIYLYSRGSHEDQVRYIEKTFHISIIDKWKRWPDFIEVFERRNLIAHGEEKFTSRYVSLCLKSNHKGSETLLGVDVQLTSRYLHQAIDILVEFAALLVFSLWRKHVPEDKGRAYKDMNQVAFELIQAKKYTVATKILDYLMVFKKGDAPEDIRQMMVINLASAAKHCGDNLKCTEVLGGVDWSASSENYKICVAALREDVQGVTQLMPVVRAAKSITADDFRIWPVFAFVRDNADVKNCFQLIYGENLTPDGEIKNMAVAP